MTHPWSLFIPKIFSKYPMNIPNANLKKSSKNLYDLYTCCIILFSKDVFKGSFQKYVIFNPLKIILRIFKTTKTIEKSLVIVF
jgi:hypothetical protein